MQPGPRKKRVEACADLSSKSLPRAFWPHIKGLTGRLGCIERALLLPRYGTLLCSNMATPSAHGVPIEISLCMVRLSVERRFESKLGDSVQLIASSCGEAARCSGALHCKQIQFAGRIRCLFQNHGYL